MDSAVLRCLFPAPALHGGVTRLTLPLLSRGLKLSRAMEQGKGRRVLPTFQWTCFDVSAMLPSQWRQEVAAVAADVDFRDFPRTPGLTRENDSVRVIPRGRVHADIVLADLNWLYAMYRGGFRRLAERVAGEPVAAARDDRYGVVLNVLRGTRMRFECHVDSNPLTGLLFCTDHFPGEGGELVFAHNRNARGRAEIDEACSKLRAQSGHLIFFDGRSHPHYVRSLTADGDIRVATVMNYYTESFPESTRPPGLNRHLFGDA